MIPALKVRDSKAQIANSRSGVYTLASGAGGAEGAIALGGAPQRSAQPQEYEVHDLANPEGVSDL